MRHLPFSVISLIATFAAAPALAGQIVKNGGAIVNGECYRDDSGNPVAATEIVDFYEAKVLRSWDLALGEASDSVESKVEKMFARLAVVDPDRAAVIRGWYATFDAERAWLRNGASLPSVDDTGDIASVLPPNCNIRQAAGQRIPENLPFDPYYIVDVRWWDQLNNDSKAGLIVHELIYRDGVRRGHVQSVGTRFLTALLATDLIDRGQITAEVYQGILFRNKFDSYTAGNYRLYPERVVATIAEAQAFCAGLADDSQVPGMSSSNLYVDGTYFSHSAFKGSAIGRFVLALPDAQRVIWAAGEVVKVLTSQFSTADIYQNVPAMALCYVRI